MRKNRIPTDMTLQDFRKLAERHPNLEGNWIYRLTRTIMCNPEENGIPKFDVYEDLPICFLSFQEAENRIKDMASNGECEERDQTYCFHVTQYPLGCPAECGAQWLYDHEGNLIDYIITSWTGDALSTTFFGRPENRHRFKCGDIVEVMNGDEVKLALLLENPPSIEWCWNLYQRCLNDEEDGPMPYFLDASDDCCYLIDGPGHEYHSHVSPMLIMPLHRPIPEAVEKEMKGWWNNIDVQET